MIWIDDSADLPVLYSWVLGGDGCGTSPNGGSSVPRCQGYHERDRSTEGTSGGRPAQGGTFGVAGRDGGNDAITLFGSVDRTADAGPAASGREAAARLARTCPRRGGEFILDEDALPRLPEGSRLMINRIDRPIGQRRLDVQA